MEKNELLEINFLLQRIAQCDEQALISLYEKIGSRILSVVKGIVKDHILAEDVIQETMIKIVKNASSFKKYDNGYGWICTIARNESYNLLRTRKIEYDIDNFYNISDFSLNISSIKIDVNIAMDKLDPADRKLIWMKYMLGMTVREIAKEVKESKSNIAIKIIKAEKELKKLLFEYGTDEKQD